jgi:hypothetical protein
MKPIKFIIFLLTIISGLSAFETLAQSVKQNEPPSWAPAYGERSKESVRYYYFPDISAYYDVNKSLFIAWNGGKWTISPQLPVAHKNLDLSAARKVILDFKGENPHYYFQKDQKAYPKQVNSTEQPDKEGVENKEKKDQKNKGSGKK